MSCACTLCNNVVLAIEISANCGSCSIPGNMQNIWLSDCVSVCCEVFVGALVHVAKSGLRRMLGPSMYVLQDTVIVHDLHP